MGRKNRRREKDFTVEGGKFLHRGEKETSQLSCAGEAVINQKGGIHEENLTLRVLVKKRGSFSKEGGGNSRRGEDGILMGNTLRTPVARQEVFHVIPSEG